MERETKIETLFGREILNHNSLRMVTLTSASMVIQECKAWSDHRVSYSPPRGTVLGDLNDTLNWAKHGFVNALQSHVEIIYAYVKYLVDNPDNNFLDYSEALLLAKALSTYQRWKEEKIMRDKEKIEEWGNTTEFNKAIWNDCNEELLAMYKK